MKKFARHKTVVEIHEQCKAQGVYLDLQAYRRGGDTICVGCPSDGDLGHVIYNTFNGRFFGKTPSQRHVTVANYITPGVEFDSSSTKYEREPWFQALLSFFYVEK